MSESTHAIDTARRDAYMRDGWVRVPGMLDRASVEPMRERLRAALAELAFAENAGAMRPAPGTETAFWSIGQDPAFAALPRAFARALDHGWGPGAWRQAEGEHGGLVMPNLPCPGVWAASPVSWHVDEATPHCGTPSSVMIGFALLDDVEPGGGGTVVLAGSPRRLALLADRLGRPVDTDVALAALAAEEPWFADLLASDGRTIPPGCVSAGVPLEVVELTGAAGDILMMDPRCLHTTAANTSSRPRLWMRLTGIRRPRPSPSGAAAHG